MIILTMRFLCADIVYRRLLRRGISTSICPQTAEKEWTGMEVLYPYTSVLIANEDEGRGLAGLLPGDDLLRAATILATHYGIPLVVLTLGNRGAIAVWYNNESSPEGDIIHWMASLNCVLLYCFISYPCLSSWIFVIFVNTNVMDSSYLLLSA